MFMRLDDIIGGARNVLARGGERLAQGVGGAINNFADGATSTASRVATRGIDSFSDSPLDYATWRAMNLVQEQNPELADYANRSAKQGRFKFADADSEAARQGIGDIVGVENLGQIGGDEYALLKNAYNTARQEMAAGQTFYDPRTQVMFAEGERARQRAADPVAYDTMQQQALGRFLQNFEPRAQQEDALTSFVNRTEQPSYSDEDRELYALLKQRKMGY